MIEIHIKSLTFKPALDQDRHFIVSAKLTGGVKKQTEPYKYDRNRNLVVFPEVFEFKVGRPDQENYLTLTIFEITPHPDYKREVLAMKTMRIDKSLQGDHNRIYIELESQEIIVNYSLHYIEESKSPHDEPAKETRVVHSSDDLEFLAPLFERFVQSLTPIVWLLDRWEEIKLWKYPTLTVLFALIVPLLLLLSKKLALFLCIIYLLVGQIIVEYYYRMTIHFPRRTMYRKNLKLFEKIMKKYLKVQETITRFRASDQEIIEPLMLLRKITIAFIAILGIFSGPQIMVLSFWIYLLIHTPPGERIYYQILVKCEIYGEKFNNTVIKYVNEKNLQKVISEKNIETIGRMKNAVTRSLMKQLQNAGNKKVFTTWENQRYSPGQGWSSVLLAGERAPWSDEQGNDTPKESYELPGKEWKWNHEWQVEKQGNCDEEGWEYAADFSQPVFHAKSETGDRVRRRKWTRDCSKGDYLKEISNLKEKYLANAIKTLMAQIENKTR